MVLIISNEPQTAQLLHLALLAQGGVSFTAGLNEVSLATFNSLRPSCVIVDTPHISQPEPLQLVAALRQQDAHVGIMFCTAVYSSRFEPYLAQAGVDDVLRKPFTLESLRRQLKKLEEVVRQRSVHPPTAGKALDFPPDAVHKPLSLLLPLLLHYDLYNLCI